MEKTPVKIIAFQEDGLFVAHCVDYDIAASAEKLDKAISRLRLTVEAEKARADKRGLPHFHGIGPAPEYVRAMYEAATMNVRTGAPTAEQETDFKLAA